MIDRVDCRPTGDVETGMGLVEEPQRRAPGDERSERHPAALPVGEPTDACPEHATGDAEPFERVARRRRWDASRASEEVDVLGAVRSSYKRGGVADETDVTADGPAIDTEVVAEHVRLTRDDRHQSRDRPEDARLPRSVRAEEVDDLATFDLEVHSGKEREAT